MTSTFYNAPEPTRGNPTGALSSYHWKLLNWHFIALKCLLGRGANTGWLIEHGLTSPPTQYRLYGRRFLQVKRPNQQYQSTEGRKLQRLTQAEHMKALITISVAKCMHATHIIYNNSTAIPNKPGPIYPVFVPHLNWQRHIEWSTNPTITIHCQSTVGHQLPKRWVQVWN